MLGQVKRGQLFSSTVFVPSLMKYIQNCVIWLHSFKIAISNFRLVYILSLGNLPITLKADGFQVGTMWS